MTERYIDSHFDSIKKYANVIENRLDDSCCTPERLIAENQAVLEQCRASRQKILLIDGDYPANVEL